MPRNNHRPLVYSVFLGVKLTPCEHRALARLRHAYGLSSMSDAVRLAITQTAIDRGLMSDEVRDGTQ